MSIDSFNVFDGNTLYALENVVLFRSRNARKSGRTNRCVVFCIFERVSRCDDFTRSTGKYLRYTVGKQHFECTRSPSPVISIFFRKP